LSTRSGEGNLARETGALLGDEHRATLARLGDELIPAADGMPSASAAGVASPLLDEVLRLRPDFRPTLIAVLDRFASIDAGVAIANLQASDPNGFFVLTEVVAGGYFLNPEVRDALGYPGQESVPIVAEDPPDYEQDGLLASVVARGPIYRPTPAGPS
jgi:hypothetical protein